MRFWFEITKETNKKTTFENDVDSEFNCKARERIDWVICMKEAIDWNVWMKKVIVWNVWTMKTIDWDFWTMKATDWDAWTMKTIDWDARMKKAKSIRWLLIVYFSNY